MARARRKVRYKAARRRFLTLDEVEAFVRDVLWSGAHGGEDVYFASHMWNDGLRRVKVEVDLAPTTVDHPVSVYVESPARVAAALRRHFGTRDIQELAQFLTTGHSPARTPPREQSSTVSRRTVVEYKAPSKRALTLDELAAFVHQARRMGARGSRCVDGEARVVGCGVKQVRVEVDVKRAHLPVAVRFETPERTAAALRRSLHRADVAKLVHLLTADQPADSPPSADGIGRSSGQSHVEDRTTISRKVKVEHETVLTLRLDDVMVFIRDARRVGARGDEIVRAATPPRHHGQTLWNLSVEVQLPPVDRIVRAVSVDRIREVERPVTTRRVRIERSSPGRGNPTLGGVAEFVRHAARAGAHGDETVMDPSRNYQLSSLCVEVETEVETGAEVAPEPEDDLRA